MIYLEHLVGSNIAYANFRKLFFRILSLRQKASAPAVTSVTWRKFLERFHRWNFRWSKKNHPFSSIPEALSHMET